MADKLMMKTNRKLRFQLFVQNGLFVLLFLALIALLGYASKRFHVERDITQGARNQLTEGSANIVKKMPGVINVTAFVENDDAERKKNIQRMLGQAGASGDAGATGTAAQSAGPSASYAGRITARIRPNIVFADEVAGNPTAEVEVRAAPDGMIMGRKLVKCSGVAAYDNAVLRAIDKTEVLPRDVDGRVPSSLLLVCHLS